MPNLSNQQFYNLLFEGNDLFSQTGKYAPQPKQRKPPKWFTNIPKDAKKWICTLHDSVEVITASTRPPSTTYNCCPHTFDLIIRDQPFVAIWHNNHEFIKPFEKEIADLIGTVDDPNGYQFADAKLKDSSLLIVQKMRDHQILQPITIALRQAHKSGFVGSFKRYDEIILQLAQQAGNLLTESHNKIFDRYEKCRNLALATPEMGERHTAAIMAYEQGRKLVDQLMEALKPPPTAMDDFTDYLKRNWKWHIRVEGDCTHCDQYVDQLYMHSSTGRHYCIDCVKGEWEIFRMRQPKGNPRVCQRCGFIAPPNTFFQIYNNPKTNVTLCIDCTMRHSTWRP